jgi:hypothetical protein
MGHESPTRRRFLRAAGVGVAALLAGCGGSGDSDGPNGSTASGEPGGAPPATDRPDGAATPDVAARDDVVDLVTAGADPTGEISVNQTIENEFEDGATLLFPPGEYFLDPIGLAGSNWSLVGQDATLVVPDYVDRNWLALDGAGWTVEGFTVDLRAENAAPVNFLRGTDWAFRDVEFVGQMAGPDYRSGNLLYPEVQAQDATGLVEGVRAMDGSADVGESSNRALTWFGQNNRGTLTWRDCSFSGWAENTLYGANSAGRLVVEDCLFRNTNVGVRVGGNSVVRGCRFDQRGPVPIQRWTGDSNARGIWINSNEYTAGEVLVDDCTFLMTGPDASAAVNGDNAVDDVTVRDCRIVQGNDWPAITIPGDGALRMERTVVTGSTREPAVELANRDGSTVVDSCVQKRGVGVRIVDSANCRIVDSTVDVAGQPFSFENANVQTTGVSLGGGCATPFDGSRSGESPSGGSILSTATATPPRRSPGRPTGRERR